MEHVKKYTPNRRISIGINLALSKQDKIDNKCVFSIYRGFNNYINMIAIYFTISLCINCF